MDPREFPLLLEQHAGDVVGELLGHVAVDDEEVGDGQITDADGLAALDFLAARPDVDKDKVAIVGWSMGGAVASAVAGRTPHEAQLAAIDESARYLHVTAPPPEVPFPWRRPSLRPLRALRGKRCGLAAGEPPRPPLVSRGARGAGLSLLEVILMSGLVFAGSAQFVALDLWTATPAALTRPSPASAVTAQVGTGG